MPARPRSERKQASPRLGQPVRRRSAANPVVSGQQNQATSFGEVGLFGVITAQTVTLSSVLKLANLTTTQRDALTASNGMIIYNSSTNKFQGYENGAWANLI